MRYINLIVFTSILFASSSNIFCEITAADQAALVEGNLAKIKQIRNLKKVRGEKGKTALYFAVLSGSLPVVKHLVKKGLSVKAKDSDGKTVLLALAESPRLNEKPTEFLEIAKYLVAEGADPKAADKTGANILLYIALTGKGSEAFKFFVQKGVDVNKLHIVGKVRATPVSGAFVALNEDVVRYIIGKAKEGLEITPESMDFATKGLAEVKKVADKVKAAALERLDGSGIEPEAIVGAKKKVRKMYSNIIAKCGKMSEMLNDLKAAVAEAKRKKAKR